MAQLHYLTVQDVLWINLQVTKKVQHFQFARLEEATYYQYAYGATQGIFAQAARFAGGFEKMHPFEVGNAATAFVGTLAFFALNGLHPQFGDDEAVAWFNKFASGSADATASDSFIESEEHGKPDPRSAIRHVLDQFVNSIEALAKGA